MPNQFTKDEKRMLLSIAREAIVSHISRSPAKPREIKSDKLSEEVGCFVTIKADDKLRGCIGNFISNKPLHRLVQEMAIAAATQDPRFYPMKESDLGSFKLEISVLSPLRKIAAVDEIQVGVHGIYLERNVHRGVLLPQVAVEHGWDRETFLQQTSRKAGMGLDDWKDNTDIYVFSATVFNEDEIKPLKNGRKT